MISAPPPLPDSAPTLGASTPAITDSQKIDILFEEYKALYGLAQFRLTSLDRRATLAWAALGSFLAGFAAMQPDAQRAFLLGVPLALFWLLRTTINHARSFEDALRRLDEIECAVNRLAGENLLVFQSRHPSRGGAIGGRTGTETILTVLMTTLAMLVACGFLFFRHTDGEPEVIGAYAAYLALMASLFIIHVHRLRSYRYRKARTATAPRSSAARSRMKRKGWRKPRTR